MDRNINNTLKRPVTGIDPAYTKIAPVILFSAKASDFNPLRYIAAGNGQDGRASGAAITADTCTALPISYSCVEKRITKTVDDRDVANFGGEFAATQSKADACVRGVEAKLDTALATVISGSGVTALDPAVGETAADQLIRAVNALADITNRDIQVMMTRNAWAMLKNDTSIQNLIKNSPEVQGTISDIGKISNARFALLASSVFGAEFVVLPSVYGTTYCWVQVKPTEGLTSLDEEQAVTTIIQDIEGVEPHDGMAIANWYDDNTACVKTSAYANVDCKVCNAAYITKLTISTMLTPPTT